MENYLDRFAFIKVLVPKDNPGLFADGMRTNYNLEEDDNSYKKYTIGAAWEEFKPEHVNDLNIGQIFIGVSKSDSMSREYVVIAKDKEGKAVWYPISGPDSAVPVVIVYSLEDGTNFKPLFTSEMTDVLAKLNALCEPGKFYVSTTVNGELVPLLGIDDDEDEDEEDWDHVLDDDDDEDDEEEDEDEDLVRDRSEFSTVDCVFTCILSKRGTKTFVSVAKGLNYDERLGDMRHSLLHQKEELEDAQQACQYIADEIAEMEQLKVDFTAAFTELQSKANIDILNPNLVVPNTDTEEPVESDKAIELPEPEPEVPAVEDDEPKVIMTPLLKKLHEEEAAKAKGDSDGGETPADYPNANVPAETAPEEPEEKPADPFAGW